MDSLITEAIADEPSGSSLQLSRSRTGSPEYVDTSATGSDTDSERAVDDCTEHYCFYKEHLVSTDQNADQQHDYFLLEHLNAGHLTPCNPLSASTADATVLTAPIREELPSDQVHCLEPVDIRQELLSPRHIRLLKLSPRTYSQGNRHARKDSALRCEVYQASLDDLTTDGLPLFAAASYVCGDQTHTKHIQCGRKLIGIPQNVYDVLRHLRFENRSRLVWVDYLCIKQRDALEKSHQVGMLHKIYAQAHVISWLGTGSGMDLKLVLFYLSMSARLWTEAVRADQRQQGLYRLAEGPVALLESYIDSRAKVRPHQCAMQALSSIAGATYFQRVWILQEFILGKTNTCQIGGTLHSVAVLAAAAQVLSQFFFKRPYIGNFPTRGYEFHFEDALFWHFQPALQNQWRTTASHELPQDVEVVTKASERFCSDPRDYIYGVVSLFQDPDAYIVDYTLSVAEVFADFTVHCLSISESISTLNKERLTMYVADTIDLRSDLPTWCPDWSVNERGNIIRFDQEYQAHCGWNASGMTEFVYSRPSRVTLALRGLTVSSLKLCCDSFLRWRQAGGGDKSSLVWLERGMSLCDFLELQGLQVDHDSRDMILGVFTRVLHSADLRIDKWMALSKELRLLLGGADQSELVSLLVPLYLAKADPELFKVVGFEVDERIPPKDYADIIGAISQSLGRCSDETCLFFTENGMMGTGYPGAEEGDLVCIIYGSSSPQILRQTDEEGHFILVGACNVDGLMFGEGLDMRLPEHEFILV
jgi:hypothetical protein